GKEKTHYLWIKNPNKLIFTITKKACKKHLCTHCGQYFSSEIVFRKHQKYCHGHTDVPQFTELPEKESSTVLETFENAEENTNVEEESADDEIEE
ncbi:13724_t:CDS:2, partial [Entrophospora sp. SA101]